MAMSDEQKLAASVRMKKMQAEKKARRDEIVSEATQTPKNGLSASSVQLNHYSVDVFAVAKKLGAEIVHRGSDNVTLRKGAIEICVHTKQSEQDIITAFNKNGIV